MVRWVVRSILHGGPIELFLVPASVPVCGMMHIKEPLLLIIKKGRKEMFYLTTHLTHFIYGYMASGIW